MPFTNEILYLQTPYKQKYCQFSLKTLISFLVYFFAKINNIYNFICTRKLEDPLIHYIVKVTMLWATGFSMLSHTSVLRTPFLLSKLWPERKPLGTHNLSLQCHFSQISINFHQYQKHHQSCVIQSHLPVPSIYTSIVVVSIISFISLAYHWFLYIQ